MGRAEFLRLWRALGWGFASESLPWVLKHRNGNGESRDVRWDAPWLVPAEVALLVGTAATHKQHRPVVSGCGSGAVLVKLTHDG